MAAKIDRLGETRMMNCGMEATIIQYKNAMTLTYVLKMGL